MSARKKRERQKEQRPEHGAGGADPLARVRSAAVVAGVAALLAVHLGLAASSIGDKCCTFDEIAHLTRGYSYWEHDDLRLISHHPPLAHAWAVLPLLNDELRFPSLEQKAWYESDVYSLGKKFFYGLGNDPDAMLRQARLMIVPLSMALGVVSFLWSRRLFGTGGGFVCLALYALSPTVLAHSRLATTDMMVSLWLLLSVAGLWWVLHRVHLASVLISAATLALLFLTKMSAVLIIPMGLGLLVLRLTVGRPMVIRLGREWNIQKRWKMAAVLAGVMAFYAAVVWVSIWGAYGFRYESMVDGKAGRDRYYAPPPVPTDKTVWEHQGRRIGQVAAAVEWGRAHRILPEAYLYMTLFTRQFMRGHDGFIDGKRKLTGWWYFFPLCFAYKVALPVMGVMVLACGAVFWGRRQDGDGRGRGGEGGVRRIGRLVYDTAPLWVLMGVYWGTAIGSSLNIGHRHLMPTFAPMFVLCGAGGWWLGSKRRWMRLMVPGLLVCLFFVTAGAHPHYLAFFNSIAGGSENGYRHLVDSSLDWGQDLPGLKKWLDKHRRGERVYVGYFGTGNARHYGVRGGMLPYGLTKSGTGDFRLRAGIYCISATRLQQIYLFRTSEWTREMEEEYGGYLAEVTAFVESANEKEVRGALLEQYGRRFRSRFNRFEKLQFARLCAYLRGREPDDNVGHSILIYRLDEDDLDGALRQALE